MTFLKSSGNSLNRIAVSAVGPRVVVDSLFASSSCARLCLDSRPSHLKLQLGVQENGQVAMRMNCLEVPKPVDRNRLVARKLVPSRSRESGGK